MRFQGWTLLLSLGIAWSASGVTMAWTFIGDPGNAADQSGACSNPACGAVSYSYSIGTYEVTNAQYAEFLNAKAASDPHNLYNGLMDILRSGAAGTYSYEVTPGNENRPVTLVSYYDVRRFTNWMNNGQGDSDTETETYTFLGPGEADREHWSARNSGATIFVPSDDEWYKAAYYDPVSGSFNPWAFADGFNGVFCEAPPGTTSHSGNCDAFNQTTDIGA